VPSACEGDAEGFLPQVRNCAIGLPWLFPGGWRYSMVKQLANGVGELPFRNLLSERFR
jgi:hypothetical protein